MRLGNVQRLDHDLDGGFLADQIASEVGLDEDGCLSLCKSGR